MTVAEIERLFFELKGKLQVGAISDAEFRAEMKTLQFRDERGKWWMMGAQSGQWYGFDGTRWVPGAPPRDATPSEPAEIAVPTPESVTQEIKRAAIFREIAAPPSPAQPARAEPTPEHLRHDASPGMREALFAPPRETYPSLEKPRRNWMVPLVFAFGILAICLFGVGAYLLFNNPFASPANTTPVARNGAALPANVNALIAMGDRLLLESQVDAAIKQYESAAKLASTHPIPHVRLARAFAYRGQIQTALTHARQATQVAPNDADAQAQLARVLLWSGQVDQAISAGEKATTLDPKNANAHAAVAEAYLHAKRLPDAQKAALAALQFAPNSADAHRAQAWTLTLAGQKENALAEWNRTVTLEPNFFFRHYEVAEVERVFFNLPNDAIAEYQKAISLYGAYIPAISRLGYVLLDANRAADAAAQLQRALTLDPNNAEITAYLGVAYQRQNKCGQALAYYALALQSDPNNSIALKGSTECKSGKTSAATAPSAPSVPLGVPTLISK